MFFLLYFLIKLCANFGDWADFEWSPGFFRFKSQLWKIICLDYIRFWRQSNVNFSFSWLFIDLLMIISWDFFPERAIFNTYGLDQAS